MTKLKFMAAKTVFKDARKKYPHSKEDRFKFVDKELEVVNADIHRLEDAQKNLIKRLVGEMTDLEIADKLYKAFVEVGGVEALKGKDIIHYPWFDKKIFGLSVYKSGGFLMLRFRSNDYQLSVGVYEHQGGVTYYEIDCNYKIIEASLNKFKERLLKFISEELPKGNVQELVENAE